MELLEFAKDVDRAEEGETAADSQRITSMPPPVN
jgi:hypothetical protein